MADEVEERRRTAIDDERWRALARRVRELDQAVSVEALETR